MRTRVTKLKSYITKYAGFMSTAALDFAHVGTFFPSSRWASATIVKKLPPNTKTIVEYGAGDGRLTRRLLDKLPSSGKLFAIEVNAGFVASLKELAKADPRLYVIDGDVIAQSARLKDLVPEGVNAVISGIPFSFLSPEDRKAVVDNTASGLSPEGRFIVYQNSPMMKGPLSRRFPSVKLSLEPRNIPPYFIMVASEKT